MPWFGKFTGGILGYHMARFPGLLIGVFLGHLVDESDPIRQVPHSTRRRYRGQSDQFFTQYFSPFFTTVQDRHQVFFLSVFSMLARVARADGAISASEIASVERFMEADLGLDPQRKEYAKNVFRAARASDRTFTDYAGDFYRVFRHQPVMLENLVDILFRVAVADGALHPAEEQLLRQAAATFRLPPGVYERIQSRYRVSPDRHYEILGCTRETPVADIKKRYRKLVLENHPDRVVQRGQPEEFVKLANEKFREIQEAYEAIKAERGFS